MPSPYFDRQRMEAERQAERVRRVVFRDTDPRPLPIEGLERVAIPDRVPSFTLSAALAEAAPVSRMIDDIVRKLAAEAARLERMLPPAPYGKRWQGEIQTRDADFDFAHGRADLTARVVYRLVDDPAAY